MPYDELGNYIPESLALDEMLYELAKKGSMPVRPGGSDVPYVMSDVPEHYVAKPKKPPVTTATNVPQAIADRLGMSAIPQAALQIATAFPAEVAKGMGYPEASKSIAEFGRPTSEYANAINEALSVAPQVITGSHMGLGPMPETWVSGLGNISPDDIRVLAKQNIERGRELRAIPEDFANARAGFQRESALGGNTYGGNLQRAAEDVGDVMARNQARRSEYSAPMTGSVEVFGNLMPDNAMYAVRPSKTGNQVMREVPTELNPAYIVTGTSSLTEDLASLVNANEPVTQDDRTYRRNRQYTNMVPENFNKSAQDMYHEYIMPALAKEFPNIEPDQYAQALSMRYGQKNANDWYKKQLEAFALTPEAAEHNKAAYQMAMADPDIPDPFEFLKEVLIVPPSAQFKGEQAADQWIMKNLQDYLVEHLGTPTDPLLTLTKETGRTGIPQEGMNQLLNNRRTEDEAKIYRKEGNMPVEGTFEREIGQMTNLLGQNNLTIQLLQDRENELVTNNPGVRPQDIPGWREARKEVVQATKRKDETAKKLENLNKAQAIENYNDTLIKPKPEQRFTENMEEYEKERFPMLPTGKDTVYQMRLPTQLRELAKEVRNRLAISGAPGISGLVKAEDVSQYSIPKAVQVRAELMAQREKIGEKAAKMAEEKLITHTKKRMETMPQDGVFGPTTVGRITKDLGADQIKADLSDITYWMDHCAGRGAGSPNKKQLSPKALMLGVENTPSEDRFRSNYPTVLSHLNNKVPEGSSGAMNTYMKNVANGQSEFVDFRDTNTGIPFATLELKVSNTDPSKYRFGEIYGYQDREVTGPMVPNRGTEYTPEEIQAYRQSIADWANSQAHNLATVGNHYLSENAEIYDMEFNTNRTSLARQLGVSVKQAADVSHAMGKRFVTLDEAKQLWKTKQEEPQESLESLMAARDELAIQLREAEDPEATMGVDQMDDIRHQITDLDSRIAAIENRPPVGSRAVSPINDPDLSEPRRMTARAAYQDMTEYARRAIPGALDTTDMPARITFADDMVNNPRNYGLHNYAPAIRQIVAEEYRMNGLAPTQPAQQELQVRPDWNRQTNQVREDTLNELDEIDRYTLSSAIEETQNRFAFSQQPHEFVAELDRRAAYFEGRNQPELADAIRNVAMGYDSQIVREPVAQTQMVAPGLQENPNLPAVGDAYTTVNRAINSVINSGDVSTMSQLADNMMQNRQGVYAEITDDQRIALRQRLYDSMDRIRSSQEPEPLTDIVAMEMNRIRDNYGQEVYDDVDGVLTAINDDYDIDADPASFIERIRRQADMNRTRGDVQMQDIYTHAADLLTSTLRENIAIADARRRAGNNAPALANQNNPITDNEIQTVERSLRDPLSTAMASPPRVFDAYNAAIQDINRDDTPEDALRHLSVVRSILLDPETDLQVSFGLQEPEDRQRLDALIRRHGDAIRQLVERDQGLVLDDDHLDNIASDIVNNFANPTPEFIRTEAGDMRNGMYDLPEFREMTETQRDSAQDALANRMEQYADMMEDMEEPPTQRTPEQNAIAEATQFPRYWYQRFPNLPQEIVTNIMTRLNADDRDFEGLRVAARNRTRGTIFAGLNANAREDAVRMIDEIGNRYQNELNVRDNATQPERQYNTVVNAYLGILDANNQFGGQEGLDTLRSLPQLLRRQNLREDFGLANLSEDQINALVADFEELYASRLRDAGNAESRRLTPPEGHKHGGLIKMANGGSANSASNTSNYANPLNIYRANPTNKWGAKDRLEPTATVIDRDRVLEYAHAMKLAEQYGGPKVDPRHIANFFAVEGRSDAGMNEMNAKNPKALALSQKVGQQGFGDEGADFAAAYYDKYHTANRLGRPMPEVWNGAGPQARAYNQRYQNSLYAIEHPRNAELLNTVKIGMSDNPETIEQVRNQIKQAQIARETQLEAAWQAQQPQPAEATMPAVDIMGNTAGFKSGGNVSLDAMRYELLRKQ